MANPDYNNKSPPSVLKPEYYYTQAEETTGGHTFIVHNKPGEEAIRLAHTKGTHVEIDKEGGLQLKVVGKSHYYMADGFSHTIEGHSDIKVQGTYNLNVDKSYAATIGKDAHVAMGGKLTHSVASDRFMHTGGTVWDNIDGNKTSSVAGASLLSYGDDVTRTVKGNTVDIIDETKTVHAGGNIEFISDQTIRFRCKNFEILAEEGIIIKNIKGAIIKISADGKIVINSVRLDLNPDPL